MAIPAGDSVPVLTRRPNNNGTLEDEYISGLVQGGSWTFGGGPRVLTYSFDLNFDGAIQPWPQNWISAVNKAVRAWEAVANIDLALVGPSNTAAQNAGQGDISIALAPGEGEGVLLGIGIFPDPDFSDFILNLAGYSRTSGAFPYPRPEGDIAFDNAHPLFANLAPGSVGFAVLLHEIGHALGLKHSDDNGGNGRPTFSSLGISRYEKTPYTLMEGAVVGGIQLATPGLLDVLAIQHIYGANMSYRAGNNTHALRDGPYNIIWDAGGEDTLSAKSWTGPGGVTIDLNDGAFSGARNGAKLTAIAYNAMIENAIGSKYADWIAGNEKVNRLDGGAGGDSLNGGAGSDSLSGGAGRDSLSGGTGSDSLRGGAGSDTLLGGSGNDRLIGGTGSDSLNGDAGNDTLLGGSGNDSLVGGDSDDRLDGGAGSDSLNGGAGNDTLLGEGGSDSLAGEGGDDSLVGGGGNDTLEGGAGNDTLVGGSGDDLIYVQDVGDVVVEFDGGGADTIFVNLGFGTPYVLPEHVENLTLGNSQTDVTGNDLDNVILGGNHSNVIRGGGGNDFLSGGLFGADELFGGEGNDTLIGAGGHELSGGDGDDVYETTLAMRQWFVLDATGETGNIVLDGESLHLDPTLQYGANRISVSLFDMLTGGGPDRAEIRIFASFQTVWDIHMGTWSADLNFAPGSYPDASAANRPPGDGRHHFQIRPSDFPDTSSFTINSIEFDLTGQWALESIDLDFELVTAANGARLAGTLVVTNEFVPAAMDAILENEDEGTDTLIAFASAGISGVLDMTGTHVENVTLTGTGSVGITGTDVANVLTGNSGDNTLSGGGGNDTIAGGGGADVLEGGDGDDRIAVSGLEFLSASGGSGNDTFVLDGSGLTLDLTLLSDGRLTGIEAIDLTGSGANSLVLDVAALLDLSESSDALRVDGDDDDAIAIMNLDSVVDDGIVEIQGVDYHRLILNGIAELLVSTGIFPGSGPISIPGVITTVGGVSDDGVTFGIV